MTEIKEYKMLIDGEWVDAENSQTFSSLNPENNEPWCTAPEASESDVNNAVFAAKNAFNNWKSLDIKVRADYMREIGKLLAENAESLAKIESIDTGKILKETKFMNEYLPKYYEYFSNLAEKRATEVAIKDVDKDDMTVQIISEPIGVCAILCPWNQQLFILSNKLIPALLCGNTCVIKVSEQSPAPILEFAGLLNKVLPPGVVNVVSGGVNPSKVLTSHKDVGKLLITAGTKTGKEIIKNSSNNMASLILELGGKSSAIVEADADIENAINGILVGSMSGNGSSCISSSVLLLNYKIYDSFLEKLIERVKDIKLGPVLDSETQMGPIISENQIQLLENSIKLSVEAGAKVLCGGKRVTNSKGNYFEPTIIECSNRNVNCATEELFFACLSVIKYETEEEAIQVANNTIYGLAGAIYTEDKVKAERVARKLDAGIIYKNTYRWVSPHVSYGGRKLSGYGRLSGENVFDQMETKKSVWTALSPSTEDPFRIR